MPLKYGKNQVYQKDIAVLKKYTEDYYKITLFRSLRKKGFELIDGEKSKSTKTKNTVGNDEKLSESISRSRSRIFELALCNDWEFYATLTLNSEYHDRYSLETFRKKLTKWLNNYNSKHKTNIKYLLSLERHKDDAYHAHGFFMGIPSEHLKKFIAKDKLPMKLKKLIQAGHEIYNWTAYANAFGYTTLEPIRSKEGVAVYITKYITKTIDSPAVGLNNHLYYCSKGLKRATEEHRGYLAKDFEPDYKNDYVAVKVVRSFDDASTYFVDDVSKGDAENE